MLRLLSRAPFLTVHAPIDLKYANIRIRDGALYNGTLNPTAQANPSVTPTVNATGGGSSGGNLQAGTYYVKYTFVTSIGETLPSTESTQFTDVAGDIPRVTFPSLPLGATSINLYLTPTNGASNSETLYATGITTTTYDLQAPYVAGGVAPPVLNTTGGYAAGTSTIAVTGFTTALSNGMQFTIGGDKPIYKITSHSETLGNTTSITFTPSLDKAVYSGEAITVGPHIIQIKVGDGNANWTEKQARVYVKDRGLLDTVRNGDDEPVELKLEFTYDFLTAVSGSGVPTVEDAIKQRGEASGWVTTSADPCEPYAVDIEIEYVPPCASVQREVVLFKDFRWEDLAHDLKQSQISLTGKCNVKQPITTRAA